MGVGDDVPPGERTQVWTPGTPPTEPPAAGELASEAVLAHRFRIVRFLGRGGMGDVYEAADLELGERVALKTIRPEIARYPGAVERFRREIQLARKVTHPNVCRIFDIFHDRPEEEPGEEISFFTMELLPGETLQERLRREGPLREREALPIVRQMAAGLAAAHRAGVVHRDFKSANVMLVPEGDGVRVAITDFGLARSGPAGSGLTVRGDFLGTPEYMAPEQVTGGEITPAADIYALGVVLYEMVTGALPFVGDTALSTAAKRLSVDPPPPRLQAPDLDPAWEAAILRCLARRPEERFAGAEEVSAALDPEAPAAAPPPLWRRHRWRIAALATVLAAALLGGGWWLAHRPARVAAELLAEGKERYQQRNLDGALAAFDRARELLGHGGDPLLRAKAEGARATVFKAQGKSEAARQALAAALDLYRKAGDRGGEASQLKDLATLLVDEGKYGEAIATFERARALLATIGNRTGAAQAQGSMGLAYGYRGDRQKAESLIGEALKYFESAGDHKGQATQLINLGTLYQDVPDLDRTRSYFTRARAQAEAAHEPGLQALASYDLGTVLFAQGDLGAARQQLQEAMALQNRPDEAAALLDTQVSLGETLLEQGKLPEAAALIQQALAGARAAGATAAEASAGALLARIRLRQGDPRAARSELDSVERLAETTPDPWIRGVVALAAAQVLTAEGRAPEAIRRLESALPAVQGMASLEPDLRLAQGEIELLHGDRRRGREHLETLHKYAREHGLGLIAGKAERALAGGAP